MDNADLKETAVSISEGESDSADTVKLVKKNFVPPEISAPVDVLEATTFFQTVSSGTTN